MLRIAAIDDDARDLAILASLLRPFGEIQLTSHTELEGGLDALRSTPADLILLNLCLPKLDRLEGLSVVMESCPDTPVIVLTSTDDVRLYADAIQAGAQDCLCKTGLESNQLHRSIRNTLQRQKLQTELRVAACTDSLTGLPNRAAMISELERRLAGTGRLRNFSLLFLDVDDFKLINDGHGHEVGDRFLVEFVQRVQECLRPDDQISRFGGDEFVLILPGIQIDQQISEFLDKVYHCLSRPFLIEGNELYAAISVGVVAASDEHVKYNQLLLEADTAMFAAKSRGKSRYVWFDNEMRQEALERLSFERALWQALDKHEFELHYQPLVNIATGQLVGFEALTRWNPAQGPVSPLKFIPVAERTGIIHRIGQWVLETGCKQLAQWSSINPMVSLAVNASPVQLERSSFASSVLDCLERHKLAPKRLTIEVTESGAIKDFAGVFDVLTELRTAGVMVSIDDFGTGHSSLSQLQRLPVSDVKIDKSFIQSIGDESDYSRLFIETIHVLARSLDLGVIAEGIETDVQRRALIDCGYVSGQGYLFSPPMNAEDATELLRSGSNFLIKNDPSSAEDYLALPASPNAMPAAT